MNAQPLLFTIVTFFSTFLGGYFAIKLKSKLHYFMAFAAGVLLAIVAFDIFPEIIDMVHESNFPAIYAMVALVGGFLLFHILEKTILLHSHTDEHFPSHKRPRV